MTSAPERVRLTPVASRSRTRHARTGLIVVGCGLLALGLIQAIVDRPAQPNVATVQPSIQVRARFSGVAPGGQTTGFAVSADGTLAVVDRGRQRVILLDPNGGPLAEWGPRFESDADAQDLGGIAPTGSEWYLLDRGRSKVLRLDSSGHATKVIDLSSLGTYGPNGLATNARGELYLADTGGNRILVFSSTGGLIRSIGTAGAGLGQLKQPMSASFGPDGAMYVVDSENKRIARWDADLQPTNTWPLAGAAWGAGVDSLGRIFVPDADHRLVRMFGPRGELLAEIGGQREGELGVNFPTQVGFSPDGSALWVLGNDGLARVDLSPYAQVVPVASSGSTPLPFAAAGLVLVVVGLAPIGLRVARYALRVGPERTLASPVAPWPAGGDLETEHADATKRNARRVTRNAQRVRLRNPRARLLLAIGSVLFLLGGAGVVLTQMSLSGPTGKNDPWFRLAVFFVAGLVWAIGCSISARALPFAWLTDWPARGATPSELVPSGMRANIAGLAVALGGLAAVLWRFGHFETPEATRTLLVWLVALVLAVVACGVVTLGFRRRPSVLALIPWVLFVVALVPRVWQLADLPLGIWYDEAQGALEVRRVAQQGTYTPILNTYGKDTSGFFYLMPALALVLGDGLVAARTAAALVGSLTVSVTYLFGRELFGWRVGLAAGALLAFSRWHINFSRLGFNPISLPLCGALAFWLLARAVRRKSWSDMALAGLALGVGMHAYTGFRGMPVVALFAVAYAAVVFRWSPPTLAPRFGIYLIGFALTALPVLIFALQDPVTFNGRTAQTLILAQPVDDAEKLRQIWDTLQRHALMFNVSGDMNGRHNLPGAPMLDPLTSILVVLGLGWMLVRLFDWRTATFLAWIAVAMSGGILTLAFEAPQGVRTFGITPVLVVLAGLGLVAALDRLVAVVTIPRRVHAWRAGVAAGGLGALVIAAIAFTNLDTFFNRQMRDSDVFASFSTRETVPARAALEGRGRYESILASTTMTPSVEAAYLVPDLQSTLRPFDPAGDLPYHGQGPGLVYLETEHDQALADEVARMYPDAIRQQVRAPDGGKPVVEGFRLESDLLAAHRGVKATYRGADGVTIERVEARPGLVPSGAPEVLPAEVTWQGGLALDSSGEYAFRVPTGFELRLDDSVIAQAAGRGARVRLVRGNHAARVSGTIDAAGQPLKKLEWQTPGSGVWQEVPAQTFFLPSPGGMGLRLTLLPSMDQSGSTEPREEYVDPVVAHYYHVSPFARLHLEPRVWSAEWAGTLEAGASGTYGFSFDHSQDAAVWLDDRQVLGNLNGQADIRNTILQLSGGRHPLRVRFEKTIEGSPWVNLYWTPPGAQPSVVPGSALYAPPPEVLGPAD